jgi:hypothetical protein
MPFSSVCVNWWAAGPSAVLEQAVNAITSRPGSAIVNGEKRRMPYLPSVDVQVRAGTDICFRDGPMAGVFSRQ